MGVITKLNPTHTTQVNSLNWCVCVDISGSTCAKIQTNNGIETVLQCEIDFVKQFVANLKNISNQTNAPGSPKCILWDSDAKLFKYPEIDNLVPSDGTNPACMFNCPETACAISGCDAMMILTDGEIDQTYVTDFGNHMLKIGGQLKCVIGVLVGPKPLSPASINVSVLVPGMVGTYNGCILHYSGTDPYVLWSSGEFKNNWDSPDIDASTSWDQLKSIPIKSIPDAMISLCDPLHVAMLNKNGYVPLGSLSSQRENIFFNPTKLLQSSPRWDEIKEYPFDRICQYFKVIGKCKELYVWFKEHMEALLQQILVDDIDRINFEDLLDKMSVIKRRRFDTHSKNEENKEAENILSSFIKIRNRTVARIHIATDADIEFALENQDARQLMQFYRNMVQVMREDANAVENRCGAKSLPQSRDMYTISSISSARYSILKGKISHSSSLCHPHGNYDNSIGPIITASFQNPFLWKEQFVQAAPSYTGFGTSVECTICCDEKVTIPFILFRQKINCRTYSEELKTNLLKYYYQGILCDKCAEFFCQQKRDPNRVSCIGGVPLIALDKVPPSVRENYIKNFSEYTNLKYLHHNSLPGNQDNQTNRNSDDRKKCATPQRIVSNISSGIYNFVTSFYKKSIHQSLLSDIDNESNANNLENDCLYNDPFDNNHMDHDDANVQRNRILDLLTILSEQMKIKYSEGSDNNQIVEIFDIYKKSIKVCRR